MTTKEYLGQISRCDRMINNKITEISQLRELACSVSAVKTGEKVKSTTNVDKIVENYIKIEKKEKELDKMIDDYVDLKSHIIEQIESIENTDYYDILFGRYVEGLTFEKLSVKLTWCWRHAHRIHAKALAAFEEKYGEEYL